MTCETAFWGKKCFRARVYSYVSFCWSLYQNSLPKYLLALHTSLQKFPHQSWNRTSSKSSAELKSVGILRKFYVKTHMDTNCTGKWG